MSVNFFLLRRAIVEQYLHNEVNGLHNKYLYNKFQHFLDVIPQQSIMSYNHHPQGIPQQIADHFLQDNSHDANASQITPQILIWKCSCFDSQSRSIVDFSGIDFLSNLSFVKMRDFSYNKDEECKGYGYIDQLHTCYIIIMNLSILKVYCLNSNIILIIFIFKMEEQSASRSNDEGQIQGRWTKEEHDRFISALMAHGKNWKMIQNTVQSRTTSQVRSHAQKFFLKLLKIEKQRKKNLKKGITCVSRAEEQLIKVLSQQSITSSTPTQILHFLKKDLNEKAETMPKNKDLACQKQLIKSRTHLILQEMIGTNQQDSFLVSLIKHNMNFFHGEQGIADLIDFPEINKEQKQDEQTSNKRKRSFFLYEEDQDPAKYNEMIKKMKGQSKI